MRFSYYKLWKLLIDRGINKKTLNEMSGISSTSIAKLGNCGNVNTEILLRICTVLKCDIGDIVEIVPEGGICWKDSNTSILSGGIHNGD